MAGGGKGSQQLQEALGSFRENTQEEAALVLDSIQFSLPAPFKYNL